MAFLEPYPLLLSADAAGNMCIWPIRPLSTPSGKCILRLVNDAYTKARQSGPPPAPVPVTAACVWRAPFATLIVCGDADGVIKVWDITQAIARWGFKPLSPAVSHRRERLREAGDSLLSGTTSIHALSLNASAVDDAANLSSASASSAISSRAAIESNTASDEVLRMNGYSSVRLQWRAFLFTTDAILFSLYSCIVGILSITLLIFCFFLSALSSCWFSHTSSAVPLGSYCGNGGLSGRQSTPR